jgi:outer membrane receptor protein involved in Fe transport
MKKQLLILLLFSFFTTQIMAQNEGSIEGKTFDGNTPVEFANIVLFSKKDSLKIVKSSITDSLGSFHLKGLKLDDYTLKIQLIGYVPKAINVSIEATNPQINLGKIPFNIDAKVLNAVEISTQKAIVTRTAQGLIINASATMTQEGGTATDVLRNTPTVNVDPDGGVTLRGKTPTILINGRNSSLANTDQIPASSIESIEIINNPSAKYDADAEAGIINIKLKKSQQDGINGAVALGAGYGKKGRVNSSILLNNKQGKWNIGLAYDNRFSGRARNGEGDRVNLKLPTQYFITQRRDDTREEDDQNLRLNAAYAPNEQHEFNFEAIANSTGEVNKENLKSLTQTQTRTFTGNSARFSEELVKERGIEFALEYRRKFEDKRKKLSFNASSSFNSQREDTDISTQTLDEKNVNQGLPSLQHTYFDNSTNITNLQLDYAYPMAAKGVLEVGVKTILRTLKSDYLVSNKVNDAYLVNKNATDIFNFKEQIQAGYVQYNAFSGEKDKPTVKYAVGLRGEQIWNNGKGAVTEGFDNQYFKLFPSANIAYYLKSNEFVKLSYARRINRPRLGQLNPFVDITDSLTQGGGNPKLLPELVHSIELGYNKDWEKASFSTVAFYRYAENIIQRYTILRPDGVLFTQPRNFGNSTTYGFENIFSATLNKWWDGNLSLSLFQQKIDATNVSSDLVNNVFSWNGKLINNLKPWHNGKLQIIGIYNSPIATPQGTRVDTYNIDLGFQQKVLKEKGRLGLIVTDLLKTQRNGNLWNTPDFTYSRIFTVDSRAILLTFAYTFGTKFKDKLMENKFSNE